MEKNSKIFLSFYLILGILLISTWYYIDNSIERPEIATQIFPQPITEINFTNSIDSVSIETIFNVMTDVTLYTKVLPKNIIAVNIINQTKNVLIAEEEFRENIFTIKLLAKHYFEPYEKHTIEILSGDAKGTIIEQNFKELTNSTEINTRISFKLDGPLKAITFLPKNSLVHAMNTVVENFVLYAKTTDQNFRMIDDLYREILLRPVDEIGLRYYGSLLESENISINDIREELMNSEEYASLSGLSDFKIISELNENTKKIIDDLYREILLRPVV